jgi:hypothetical protein
MNAKSMLETQSTMFLTMTQRSMSLTEYDALSFPLEYIIRRCIVSDTDRVVE